MQKGNAVFRQDLADALMENNLGANNFAGNQIMPIKLVDAQAGNFGKLSFSEVKTQAVDDLKARGSEYNEITHEVTEDTYTTIKRGLVEPVDIDDNTQLSRYFDLEMDAANLCKYYLMLNREARIANIAFDTDNEMSSYTSAVSTAWSTAATCTPVLDVETAKEKIQLNLNGMSDSSNRIIGVGNRALLKYLRNSADIKDRVYAGGNIQGGEISVNQLAEILGLDGLYFSNLKRAGSDIWDDAKFGVYLVSEGDSIKSTPQFGRTMLWRESTPSDMMVESWYDDARESEMIRVKHNSTEKLLTARAGWVLTSVTS